MVSPGSNRCDSRAACLLAWPMASGQSRDNAAKLPSPSQGLPIKGRTQESLTLSNVLTMGFALRAAAYSSVIAPC